MERNLYIFVTLFCSFAPAFCMADGAWPLDKLFKSTTTQSLLSFPDAFKHNVQLPVDDPAVLLGADDLTGSGVSLRKRFEDCTKADVLCDEYGGVRGPAGLGIVKTGFFQVQLVDKRWWFIDPNGRVFFSVGVSSVTPNDIKPEIFNPRFHGDMYDPVAYNNWAQETTADLQNNGFNTLAGWSDDSLVNGLLGRSHYDMGLLSQANGTTSTPMVRTPLLGFMSFKDATPENIQDRNDALRAVVASTVQTVVALAKAGATQKDIDTRGFYIDTAMVLKDLAENRATDAIVNDVLASSQTTIDSSSVQFILLFKKDADGSNAFENFSTTYAAKKLVSVANDPRILGYFTDNELPFRDDLLDVFLRLPDTHYARIEADAWLKMKEPVASIRSTVRKYILNANVGISAAAAAKLDEDRQGFVQHVATAYFGPVHRAIRKVDAHHLILGSKWNLTTGGLLREKGFEQGLRKSGLFCGARDIDPVTHEPNIDVISVNYYGSYTPNQSRLEFWKTATQHCPDKVAEHIPQESPLIVSEFYARKQNDEGKQETGAGQIVKTEVQRGEFYQNFTLGLLRSSAVVGWHWFKYMSTEDGAKACAAGLYNDDLTPYSELQTAMKPLNEGVYGLRRWIKLYCDGTAGACPDVPVREDR